jgi:hypothetical protein
MALGLLRLEVAKHIVLTLMVPSHLLCASRVFETSRSLCCRLLQLLDEGDVVALEQNLSDVAPLLGRLLFRVGQRDLDRVVNDEVHELVEALSQSATREQLKTCALAYPELSLDAHPQVLVEPY